MPTNVLHVKAWTHSLYNGKLSPVLALKRVCNASIKSHVTSRKQLQPLTFHLQLPPSTLQYTLHLPPFFPNSHRPHTSTLHLPPSTSGYIPPSSLKNQNLLRSSRSTFHFSYNSSKVITWSKMTLKSYDQSICQLTYNLLNWQPHSTHVWLETSTQTVKTFETKYTSAQSKPELKSILVYIRPLLNNFTGMPQIHQKTF